MRVVHNIVFIAFLTLFSTVCFAQSDSSTYTRIPVFFSYDSLHQVDLPDAVKNLFRKHTPPRIDTAAQQQSHAHVSVIPAAGYTLQTGFAVILSGAFAFYNGDKEGDYISTVLTSFTYTQYRQFIVPLSSNLWSKNKKINFLSDWRFLQYPSYTYGLGTRTKLKDADRINYSYLRLHQNLARAIGKNWYVGIGLDADFYGKVKEISPDTGKITDFERFGSGGSQKAIGPTFNLLYNSRRNSLNPNNGNYFNIAYRPKFTFLGSDNNWQSLLVEYRAYRKQSSTSNNVIALWSYNWFTFGAKPPYLLLPSTGWDAFANTGRGYIQGRYRGSNMLYLEAEYRFGITSNGLFGGVVFANAETFSNAASTLAGNASLSSFDPVKPAAGVGLRIRMNKFSKANLCIDYGWGTGGSHGLSVNLGEVF